MRLSLRYLLVFFLLFVTSPVYAGGLGLFVNGGEVDAEWDGDLVRTEFKGKHLDYGFAIDSNLATDRQFNYRMELGRANWEIDNFNNLPVDADLEGLVMNHDFGFGGLVGNNMRFWFGPEIRLTLLDGDINVPATRDIDLFGYGVGAAVGLNVNLPGRLTIAAKSGLIMMRYVGRGPNSDNGGATWQSSSYDIDEELVYVGVTMFFRNR